jgi:hypothetical protein
MKETVKIFKYLDKHSREFPGDFENFHLWDAESQGDMCVQIAHRLKVKGLVVNPVNVINDFKLIVED